VAFARDGRWAVAIDVSLLLFDDTEQLALLSQRFGTATAFATQGTAGFAGFRLFEGGSLRREITGNDGKVETVGTPIAAEEGIPIDRQFCLDEIFTLQRAMGFSFQFTDGVPGPFSAVHVVDTTEYPAPAAKIKRRPWWRFW
jgi:hypothetical protein